MFVGKRFLPAKDIVLYIDNAVISYVTEFKYLEVSFIADKILDVDVSYMKRRFYSSCIIVICASVSWHQSPFSYSLLFALFDLLCWRVELNESKLRHAVE